MDFQVLGFVDDEMGHRMNIKKETVVAGYLALKYQVAVVASWKKRRRMRMRMRMRIVASKKNESRSVTNWPMRMSMAQT